MARDEPDRTNLLVGFFKAENAGWEFDQFGEIFRRDNEFLPSCKQYLVNSIQFLVGESDGLTVFSRGYAKPQGVFVLVGIYQLCTAGRHVQFTFHTLR
jgi:hypothetical protein